MVLPRWQTGRATRFRSRVMGSWGYMDPDVSSSLRPPSSFARTHCPRLRCDCVVTSAVRGGLLEHPGIRTVLKPQPLELNWTGLNCQPSGSIPVSATRTLRGQLQLARDLCCHCKDWPGQHPWRPPTDFSNTLTYSSFEPEISAALRLRGEFWPTIRRTSWNDRQRNCGGLSRR